MNYLFKRKQTKYADLHIHTDRSDGLLSPEQIVAKANKAGLSTISITDHDILDGIEPALTAGKRHNVEIGVFRVPIVCVPSGKPICRGRRLRRLGRSRR